MKGASGTDRWPKLIAPYVQDSMIFAAPGDPQNHRARQADPLRHSRNNPSSILNGDNDLGTFEQPNMEVPISAIERPGTTRLLAMPKAGRPHFFMDFLAPPHGNTKDRLSRHALAGRQELRNPESLTGAAGLARSTNLLSPSPRDFHPAG